MSEITQLLNESKKMLDAFSDGKDPFENSNFICKRCKYFEQKGSAITGICEDMDDFASDVRISLVKCHHYEPLSDDYSAGYYDPKTKKHTVTWDGPKERKKRKRREKFNFYINILKSVMDSIIINNFYPLKAALRGEKYELKKEESTSNRGKGPAAKVDNTKQET